MNRRVSLITAGLCACIVSCVTFGDRFSRARPERAGTASRYHNGIYHNTIPTRMASAGAALAVAWKILLEGDRNMPSPYPAIVERRADDFLGTGPDFKITWLGHSTVLIEMDGARILTDPMLGERASPFEHAGPKRLHRAPVSAGDLPHLDAVVISHDHYDHLDYRTILALKEKTSYFCVPLDLGRHLEAWGVPRERIVEFDWWERKSVGKGIELVAGPARHFSGREPARFSRTLWSSWIVIGQRHRVFFCGDSGMMPEFFGIGKEYGPFDVTLLSIGSYDDRWPDIHLTPEDAVEAHGCLAGRVMLPVHWGTFNIARHGWAEPAERLLEEARRRGVTLALPRPGETVSPDDMKEARPWWR